MTSTSGLHLSRAELLPLAESGLAQVERVVQEALAGLGDRFLIRARIDPPRIKDEGSLARKAKQRGWTVEEAATKAEDFIGLRLVCNNLQDVRRAANLLTDSLKGRPLKVGKVTRRDHIRRPKESGYRALHLLFRLPLQLGATVARLGFEIQIRSLLQDSWGRLSRSDLYTPEAPIPASVGRQMRSLAVLLARADTTAEKIRTAIAKPRRGRRPASGQLLTESAIAFLYKEAFGTAPPDYLVRIVHNETEGAHLRADGLAEALQDSQLIESLKGAYRDASGNFGWEPDPPKIFGWVARSLIAGTEAAVRRAASDARLERSEIRSIALREALDEVSSADEVLDSIESRHRDDDPDSQIDRWAWALGGASSCEACGTTIVDAEEFADAVVRHFRVRGRKADELRERLEDAVGSSAVDQGGGLGSSSLCTHCFYVFMKDD